MFNALRKGSGSLQGDFFSIDIDRIVADYKNKSTDYFFEEGFKNALELFRETSERVPAYHNFLKQQNVNPKQIRTYEDFLKLPIIDKKNYLRAYPLKELCWDGKLDNLYLLSSSSGSTGEPFLWPRGKEQEYEGAINFELIFKEVFQADKKTTLFVNCFAMGTWIAGLFVTNGINLLSKKGYKIMTVTPGIDKDVTYGLIKRLAPDFEQVVIAGYPPLIKDIIDQGKTKGINWTDYEIKYFFAAEGFSENWRKYMHEAVGAKDPFRSSINMYGTADSGNMAHETPLTTHIRRLINRSPAASRDIFGAERLPTLAQYDPRLKFFEQVDNNLIYTNRNGIPLVRYSIGDQGGIIPYTDMKKVLYEHNYDIEKDFEGKYLWKLPFVYVFGRSDLTVSFYGLLIYPEHIKYCLEKKSLNRFITGKFVMSTENDEKQDQYLLIRVELAQNVIETPSLKAKVLESITKGLKKVNSEYARISQELRSKSEPVIELVPNGDTVYFKSGIKQKWVSK